MKINVEKQNVKQWLDVLSEASKSDHYGKLWRRVHYLVAVPSRKRASVNLYKINKNSKDGDNIVVPGKVLSTGPIEHRVNISAIEFSETAMKSLKEANCKIVDIREMIKANRVHVIV